MVQQTLMSRQALQKALSKLPRVPLAVKPTPLEECPRLSDALGGPRILIKRDDLTGLAFGGNKARHLEFRIARARSLGCDVFINSNVWVSNNARVVAAACAKVGMRCIFVVRDGKGKPFQGNLLLDHLLGTEIHRLEGDDREQTNAYCKELAARLTAEGHRPYLSGEDLFARISGTFGYLECTMELADQMKALNIAKAHIYLVAGTSMAGLALGAKLLGLPWKVTGIYSGDRPSIDDGILIYANGARDELKLPVSLEPGDFQLLDDYIGEGYAIPTREGVEAIKLVARMEGIFLDPTYTGKGMAAVIDHVRRGILGRRDTVIFVHTGGLPGLFIQSYAKALTTW